MTKIILILVCLLCFAENTHAQQLGLRNFSTIDANSGKQNWDIDQDEVGRMLFANNSGLLIFDGSAWTTYHVANHTIVRSVKYDESRKVIFVGATNEFGYFKYSDRSFCLEYHSLSDALKEKDKAFGEIWKVRLTGGKVMFESKSSVFVFDEKLNYERTKPLVLPYTKWTGAEMLEGKTVRDVIKIENRYYIVTATDGLYVYDGHAIRPYDIDITPYLKQNEVFCAATNGTTIAFGTVKGGLVAKDIKHGTIYYACTSSNLQDNTVLSLAFDRTGNLWLGLDNGVSYVMPHAPFRKLFGTPYTSIGTGYTSLVKDGLLYLGTNQGLFCTSYPLHSTPYPTEKRSVAGISGQIWDLRKVGHTLLCAADKGAYIVEGTNARPIKGMVGTWCFVELKHHPGYILASDYNGLVVLRQTANGCEVVCRPKGFTDASGNIVEDSDGTLWISNWQKGISHFALTDNMHTVRLLGSYGRDRGLRVDEGNNVTRIDGKVYISSVDGFYRYDKQKKALVYDESLSRVFNTYGSALRIDQTADGHLWATKWGYMALAMKGRDGHYTVDSITYSKLVRQMQIGLGSAGMIAPSQTLFNLNTGFMLVDTKIKGILNSGKLIISDIVSINTEKQTLYAYNYTEDGTPSINVPHSKNNIRIHYVMPEYRDEQDVVYSIYLENYDSKWSDETFETTKEYKLSRGKYIFHVKAKNLITGKTEEKSIVINVNPAWYESWIAILVYFVIICFILRYVVKRIQANAEKELIRVKQENEQKMTKMKNEQLETELKHRYSELADSTMNLVHKNDILQQIDTRMDSLSESVRRDETKANITKAISDIRRDIQESLNDDGNWDKFEENFNLVYDNFMKKLRERYTNLNKLDLKLCAYLRMDLSSKEMASLLNISVRSIETARYRLRKKLNLSAGDNLTDFIQNLGNEQKA